MRIFLLIAFVLGLYAFPKVSMAQEDEHAFTCHPVDERGRYRNHNVDFISLDLAVTLDTLTGGVEGRADYRFSPLQEQVDTLFLDGPGITVSSVLLDLQPVDYKIKNEGFVLYFDEPLAYGREYALSINYQCNPIKGIYFLGWNDTTHRRRKQIWTQGQGIDNRHWIPSFDDPSDKLITAVKITFNERYTVVSNGVLTKAERNEDAQTKTWEYRMEKPHALYLIMLAIGEYDVKNQTAANGVVTEQYFYPDKKDAFTPTYKQSAAMMDWMEAEFGIPYPWRVYRNIPVEDFLYGAMENTTATIFTDFYLKDSRGSLERDYLQTNAHELVHQWFGNYITEYSAQHHWLHESFATHYAKHFVYSIKGEDWFAWEHYNEMQSALRAGRKNNYPVAYSNAGASRHYPKGSVVLDMLRYVVGEENYKRAIHHFLQKHGFKNVDTHQLYLAFYDALGMNLDWFFEQWIYKGGEPHFKIEERERSNETVLLIQQVQEIDKWNGYFTMPTQVEVFYDKDSSAVFPLIIDGPADTLRIPKIEGRDIRFILFDPGNAILKKVDYEKDEEALYHQLKDAPQMIDRYAALLDLRTVEPSAAKRKALQQVLENESFYAMRAEAVDQLADDESRKAQEMVLHYMNDKHHLVRREALTSMKGIGKAEKEAVMERLSDSSYTNIELALNWLMHQYPSDSAMYFKTVEGIEGNSKNVEIAVLKHRANYHPSNAIKLVDLCGPSFEMRTRLNAMQALIDMGYFSEDLLQNMSDALFQFNRRLAGRTKKYLQEYAQKEENYQTIEAFFSKMKLTEQERTKVNKILGITK